MPVVHFNSSAINMPLSRSRPVFQFPYVPPFIPVSGGAISKGGGAGNNDIGVPSVRVATVNQIIGLVPIFPCVADCREGLYKADTIANDQDFTLPVFASVSNATSYWNDKNSWLFNFPGNFNAITAGLFHLQKKISGIWTNMAVLNNSNYGTPLYTGVDSGICVNQNYSGFTLDWRSVLIGFGEGTYRFFIDGRGYSDNFPYCGFSPPFCLKAATCTDMDGTVKFEASYSGGVFGDVNNQGNSWALCCVPDFFEDSGPLQWADSIRFAGFFGYQTGEYKRDSIKYATGVIKKVRDEVVKKFTLKTDRLPKWLLDRYMAYGLMADQLYVSDYNLNNADYNLKHFYITADSDFSPKYTNYSRYTKILDLQFKEGQQFIYRDRCC